MMVTAPSAVDQAAMRAGTLLVVMVGVVAAVGLEVRRCSGLAVPVVEERTRVPLGLDQEKTEEKNHKHATVVGEIDCAYTVS